MVSLNFSSAHSTERGEWRGVHKKTSQLNTRGHYERKREDVPGTKTGYEHKYTNISKIEGVFYHCNSFRLSNRNEILTGLVRYIIKSVPRKLITNGLFICSPF